MAVRFDDSDLRDKFVVIVAVLPYRPDVELAEIRTFLPPLWDRIEAHAKRHSSNGADDTKGIEEDEGK